jgi:hypothetical protein
MDWPRKRMGFAKSDKDVLEYSAAAESSMVITALVTDKVR